MTNSHGTYAEAITFRRRSELPGVEIRTFRNASRGFSCYCTGFEFLAPRTLYAEVRHRRRSEMLEPGFVLSAHPGEVFSAERVLVPGSASSLTVDANTLTDYVSEHELPKARFKLRAITRMSSELQKRLFNVFLQVRPGPTPMQVQASMVEFVAAMADELLDSMTPTSRPNADSRVAERIRECLHEDTSTNIDLLTLAEYMNMSRFRVLRVFKRRFGIPPHAYQLQLRLGLAQKSLREGLQPALVAAEYGFVDQSHLTRHFKRLLGVTPAEYARVGGAKDLRELDPSSMPEPSAFELAATRTA